MPGLDMLTKADARIMSSLPFLLSYPAMADFLCVGTIVAWRLFRSVTGNLG
jgi:hypothetical protein